MTAPEGPFFRDSPPRRRRGGGVRRLLVIVAAAAGVVTALGDSFAASLGQGERIRLVALAVMLGVFLPLLFYSPMARNLRNLLVWVAMLGLLAAGYSLWRQSGRLVASPATAPTEWAPAAAESSGAAVIRANRRGDYIAHARVDGVPVAFLVDTGASDVVLSRADARRVGFDPDALRYTRRYATANGPVFAAPIRLREIAVGGVRVANVRGAVTDSDLGTSLLGMSFINRLSGFELSGGALTLRQ